MFRLALAAASQAGCRPRERTRQQLAAASATSSPRDPVMTAAKATLLDLAVLARLARAYSWCDWTGEPHTLNIRMQCGTRRTAENE